MAPGFVAPGLDVFVAGVLDGLHEGLAEVGDDGGLFGLDLALRGGGEGSRKGEAEAGCGNAVASECRRDVAADFLARGFFGFAACVVIAEIGIGCAKHAAAAAVVECEQTQGRAVLGGLFGHA